jgi:hypothetical protein
MVEEFIFHVAFHGRALPDKTTWEPLANALKKFGNIKKITFCVRGGNGFTPSQAYFAECFPKLEKAGVLQVQYA